MKKIMIVPRRGCVVFWDGKSSGTKMMIDLARLYNINVKISMYERDI